MRVAIYAQARSGSTTLAHYLSYSLKFKLILEPLRRNNLNTYSYDEIWKQDNVVVKFLLRDNKKVEKISNSFDKVIWLTRENDLEGAESLAQAEFKNEWHEKYFYNKYSFENKHINKLKEYRNTHKKFIQSQGNFQITYEEIFYERVGIPKINDYIGIKSDRYIHLLDIKNKYRVNKADAKRSI